MRKKEEMSEQDKERKRENKKPGSKSEKSTKWVTESQIKYKQNINGKHVMAF